VRSPFQVAVLVFCVLTGIVGLLTGSESPASIHDAYGDWSAAWNVALFVSSSLATVAMWLRYPVSILLERVGMIMLCTVFAAYFAAIILEHDESRVITGLGTTLALAVAAGVRAWQLTDQLRRLRQALK
jgi:hypothetical protein